MSPASNKAAFTLIELLVVISIIIIATSILFVGGGSGDDGLKLSSAQRIVSSVAQGARGQAVMKNATTRLIIYANEGGNQQYDKKLRFFGIVYWGFDKDGNEGWIAATQGSFLPEGIYLNEDLSKNSPWQGNTMSLDYPRLKVGANTNRENGGGSEEYFYYEFNSNGTMAPNFENSWLVLQAGTLRPDSSGDLSVVFDEESKENLKSAIIFRRVGSTTLVTDPSEISNN